MRRYRKGQQFRPPTAAESAVHADAVESYRRSPPQPQGQLTRGSVVIVKTPEGGIPARDGTTLYSAVCTRCIESSIADEKELLETDEELIVFNLDAADVPGASYMKSCLTSTGTRYVERGLLVITAQVDEAGDVATTDATFDIDTVVVISPAGGTLGTPPTTVNNFLGFPAQDDAAVIAIFNATSGEWEGIPAPWLIACP